MNTLLIRAEDKNQWERRSAIVPNDLQKILTSYKVKAFIEPSEKRYYKMEDFISAGAKVFDKENDAKVILGVKEIPIEKITDDSAYLYFSHTIKGQEENMPMLQHIIDSGSTLIDYEKIVDDSGRRLVYFGPFAGDAGALNILWLMGEYWQHKGVENPFIECKQALKYDSVAHAKSELQKIGHKIIKEGLPRELCPFIIGILGYGNVSQGAQKVLNALPVEYIDPDQLTSISKNDLVRDKIYVTVFKEEHLVKAKGGLVFDLEDYFQNPENYEPCFNQYLPYLSILINATYWDTRYPRFVTWDDLQQLAQKQNPIKLVGIADITCDVNGSIEANVKTTDSGQPAYRIIPQTKSVSEGHKGEGIVLLAVDNLPAELPKDASDFFSHQLSPFVPSLIKADFSKPIEDSGLALELQRATIVYKGELTQDFRYLQQYL